jgi:hypothetical protein
MPETFEECATMMYEGDNNDKLTLFGDVYPPTPTMTYWFQKVAPYVVKQAWAPAAFGTRVRGTALVIYSCVPEGRRGLVWRLPVGLR